MVVLQRSLRALRPRCDNRHTLCVCPFLELDASRVPASGNVKGRTGRTKTNVAVVSGEYKHSTRLLRFHPLPPWDDFLVSPDE